VEQLTLGRVGLPAGLAADLARLRAAGPQRWRPSRLILQNYWLFDDEAFHFVQGRLVLRGANGSGKSTALAAAVTLVLDADKRRQNMDTFGGQGRGVAYYLVGEPTAKPDSAFYHDERTAYVALEFEDGRTGAFVTVGVGLHTTRARPDLAVDAWGFLIRDGRRLRVDLDLHTGGPNPVPLTMRELRGRLGDGGVVVDAPATTRTSSTAPCSASPTPRPTATSSPSSSSCAARS
jgi:energy-coupling factor transporter ATP-binding protein EcfA2